MKTEDFIYKNIAKLLSDKYKDARPGLVAMAAKHGKSTYLKQGNFKGKGLAEASSLNSSPIDKTVWSI